MSITSVTPVEDIEVDKRPLSGKSLSINYICAGPEMLQDITNETTTFQNLFWISLFHHCTVAWAEGPEGRYQAGPKGHNLEVGPRMGP